jgi:hypothetical protein
LFNDRRRHLHLVDTGATRRDLTFGLRDVSPVGHEHHPVAGHHEITVRSGEAAQPTSTTGPGDDRPLDAVAGERLAESGDPSSG